MPPVVIPRPGEVLSKLITDTGYRTVLVDAGLEQDLNDVRRECRPGANTALISTVQQCFLDNLESDCHQAWRDFATLFVTGTSQSLQHLATHLDTTCLPEDLAGIVFKDRFTEPFLQQALHIAAENFPGPVIARWWETPLTAWLTYVCQSTQTTSNELINGLAAAFEVEPRTVYRWNTGEHIVKCRAPYRQRISNAIEHAGGHTPSEELLSLFSGWLALAVGTSSISPEQRSRLQAGYEAERDINWTVGAVTTQLAALGYERYSTIENSKDVQQHEQLQHLVSSGVVGTNELNELIASLQGVINTIDPLFRHSMHLTIDLYRAWHQVMEGRDDEATATFKNLVERSWWRAGWRVKPVLTDALLHAAGIGNEPFAKFLIDRLQLIGGMTSRLGTKDAMDRQRISMAFEERFPGRKAMIRVPPIIEVVDTPESFKLTSRDLASPNRLQKYANGRTRRTRLMSALLFGSTGDVERLLEAGADPNIIVAESGESALAVAVRKAKQPHELPKLKLLLDYPLKNKTLNQPASTARETPLDLAIELDSPDVVDRLIRLGAAVETGSMQASPFLSTVLHRLHFSTQPFDPNLLGSWFNGHAPDGTDAKHGGAVTVEQAAKSRRESFNHHHQSSRHVQIMRNTWEVFRSRINHSGCLEVLKVLLLHKADANEQFAMPDDQLSAWTPTLLAARYGNIDAFQLLHEHGGDPMQTLDPKRSSETIDALFLAEHYDNPDVVEYLQNI